MSNRARSKRFAHVIEVSTKKQPTSNQRWECTQHSEREDEADNLRWRLGVCAKGVVDLRFAGVAFGGCRNDRWTLGITLDLEVECVAIVWSRGAK